jgi:hypothetical protein
LPHDPLATVPEPFTNLDGGALRGANAGIDGAMRCERAGPPARAGPSFAAVYAAVYLPALALLLLLPASEEARDFGGRVARQFPVAVVLGDGPGDDRIGVRSLAALAVAPARARPRSFLLPATEVVIDTGDVHRAEVLEEHGDWQLIAFHYANTRTSTSVYRAYRDRVEPVSHRVTSHLGEPVLAVLLLLPAAIVAVVLRRVLRRMRR